MKRALLLTLVGALMVALPVGSSLAQEEEAETAEPVTVDLTVDDVDMSNYPAVTLTVTVPVELANDTFVLSDFFVSENDEPRAVVVQEVDHEELAVVFALDTSGSMRGVPLSEAKAAITSFVDVMPEGVAFALVRFGSTSELVVPFTTGSEEVKDAVGSLAAGGETALYDAVAEAAGLFEALSGVRRSLIVLTDGGDTASVASLEDSIVSVLQSNAELVAVELQSPENDSVALQRLQIASQGELVPADNPAALEGIFSTVASDLLNQFRITFASQAGGQTELTVAIRGENVTAVSTAGYRFPDLPQAPAPTTTPPATTAPTATTAPVAIEPLTGTSVTLPWYQTTTGLVWGAITIFLGIFGVVALVRPAKVSGGVAALRGMGRRTVDRTVLSGIADRASIFAEEAIERSGGAGGLRLLLDQAGLNLRVGEFGIIAFAGLLLGFFIGNVLVGFVGALIGAIAAILVAFVVISAMASVRSRRFQEQLPDTLQLIAGALRAGFGINQAIDGVVAEAPEPTAAEFNRVRLEVQLGRDLEDALSTMADRVRSEDLRMAAEAIEIHRQVGGDLAELLERVAATIRERENIRRQIQVLSAEGRLSAVVLVALPLFIAATVRTVAPDYLSELTSTGAGQVMILVGVVLLVIGILWIRRIVRLEF